MGVRCRSLLLLLLAPVLHGCPSQLPPPNDPINELGDSPTLSGVSREQALTRLREIRDEALCRGTIVMGSLPVSDEWDRVIEDAADRIEAFQPNAAQMALIEARFSQLLDAAKLRTCGSIDCCGPEAGDSAAVRFALSDLCPLYPFC